MQADAISTQGSANAGLDLVLGVPLHQLVTGKSSTAVQAVADRPQAAAGPHH
jgi:hypothetical protein